MPAAGALYLVPVPIGNLGDITLRALETLKRVPLIAAEDTRKTRFLLSQYEIQAPRLLSLHKYNEKQRVQEVLGILASGADVAVVTDAGSPGISDPAQSLIQAAIAAGDRIIPLPGATALIPALTGSGLDCTGFQFLGFLPLKLKDRRAALDRIRDYPGTTVLYEAPHRLRRTLEDLNSHCGNRQLCLARELTKLYEEFIRGTCEEILRDYAVTEKGEFVLIVSGPEPAREIPSEEIKAFLRQSRTGTKSKRELAQELAAHFGIGRNQAYKLVLEHQGSKE